MNTTSPHRFSARQRVILLVLLGAGFMLSVDFSILNVALPEAGAGVGLGAEGLPWITSAFALPAAGCMLLFGRLADFFGRRRLFLSGMALLAAASVLGGLANQAEVMLTARALQGVATAMAMPATMALLTTTFSEASVRARVLGLRGALLSAGFAVGALVGGALVSLLGWRAAFFINVPAVVIVLVLAPIVINESKAPERMKLDVPGAMTVTGGLLAVVYAVIERSLPAGLVGVLLLIGFGLIERRSVAPLVPIRILTRPSVAWGNYAGLVIGTMEPAMIVLTTLYIQHVLGLSPFQTGLVFGIPGVASVAAGVVAGRVIGRLGYRKVLTVGLAVQGLATLPIVFLGTQTWVALVILVPALFIGFFGHVGAIVAFTVTATSGVSDEDQGLATGLASMTGEVAVTMGTPALFAIAATQATLVSGHRLALSADVAFTLVSALLIWIGLRTRTRTPATAAYPSPSQASATPHLSPAQAGANHSTQSPCPATATP